MHMDERRILSKPMPVHWAGFESNTYKLQQAGWEFTADQSIEDMTTRLIMRHQDFGMVGCSNSVTTLFFEDHHWQDILFRINWMQARNTRVVQMKEIRFDQMRPVDMAPSVIGVRTKETTIEDMVMFGAPLVRTKEIIVAPQTVPELMDRILELQDPAAKAHYAERAAEMHRQGERIDAVRPRQQFHAQVISLVA